METARLTLHTGRLPQESMPYILCVRRKISHKPRTWHRFSQPRQNLMPQRYVVYVLLKSNKPGYLKKNEPPHDKTNKVACAPSKDSDQPGRMPSLIRVFTVLIKKAWVMKKAWVLSYPLSTQRRLISLGIRADVQADLSLHWALSHFVGFVMRRLKCCGHPEMSHVTRKPVFCDLQPDKTQTDLLCFRS